MVPEGSGSDGGAPGTSCEGGWGSWWVLWGRWRSWVLPQGAAGASPASVAQSLSFLRTHANGSIKRGNKDNATESVSLRTGIGVQLKDIKVFNRARQKGASRNRVQVPCAGLLTAAQAGLLWQTDAGRGIEANGPLCPH